MKLIAKLCLVLAIVSSALFVAPQGEAALPCCAGCRARLGSCARGCGGNPNCDANCENQYLLCANACAQQQQYC